MILIGSKTSKTKDHIYDDVESSSKAMCGLWVNSNGKLHDKWVTSDKIDFEDSNLCQTCKLKLKQHLEIIERREKRLEKKAERRHLHPSDIAHLEAWEEWDWDDVFKKWVEVLDEEGIEADAGIDWLELDYKKEELWRYMRLYRPIYWWFKRNEVTRKEYRCWDTTITKGSLDTIHLLQAARGDIEKTAAIMMAAFIHDIRNERGVRYYREDSWFGKPLILFIELWNKIIKERFGDFDIWHRLTTNTFPFRFDPNRHVAPEWEQGVIETMARHTTLVFAGWRPAIIKYTRS